MSLVVNTNVGSLNAQRSLAASGAELKTAMERLSSGKKINSAADDAAGFAIAERMTAQIRGLNAALKNANDGVSLLSVAESVTDSLSDNLQRMRELAIQASNDTNSPTDRHFIQDEISALVGEVDRVLTQTRYNGAQIFGGGYGQASLQIGSEIDQTVSINLKAISSKKLGAFLQDAGSVKVWSQVGSDIDGQTAGDNFGSAVALSATGDIVAIGAPYSDSNGADSGEVRIYRRQGDNWSQMGTGIRGESAGNENGYSVTLSDDGLSVAMGAWGANGEAGQVRIYAWDGTDWLQRGPDLDGEAASDYSGYPNSSISLSSDGRTIAVGASYNDGAGSNAGHVRLYTWNESDNTWVQKGADIDGAAAGDFLGWSVSLSDDGNTVAIGSSDSDGQRGHVSVLEWSGTAWVAKGANILGESAADYSGYSVSVSGDGSLVAIGATDNDGNGEDSGQVRVFSFDGGNWEQRGGDIDGEHAGDYFGTSVSLSSDGSVLVAGSRWNDDSGNNAGHARAFEWSGAEWIQIGTDIDGDSAGDKSGYATAISSDGSTIVVGAYNNADAGAGSGHARVFERASLSTLDVVSDASRALHILDKSIDHISSYKAGLGSSLNRLSYSISNIINVVEFTALARSRIEDADFAAESARLAKAQVLQQTGTAMLAQANAQPQLVLSLIR